MNNISISIKNKIIIPILMELFFIFIFYQSFRNKVLLLTSSNIFYEKLDNFLSDYINDNNIKILYTYVLMTIYILLIINILLVTIYSFNEVIFNIDTNVFFFSDQYEYMYDEFYKNYTYNQNILNHVCCKNNIIIYTFLSDLKNPFDVIVYYVLKYLLDSYLIITSEEFISYICVLYRANYQYIDIMIYNMYENIY
jgi:hypothetical protein